MSYVTVSILFVVCTSVGGRMLFRRWVRGWRKPTGGDEKCRCGYSLRGLTMPRCPECGRVVGFDATAEELTLTNEELERAHAVREKRLKASK